MGEASGVGMSHLVEPGRLLLPRTRGGRLENEVQHYAEERALETMDDALGPAAGSTESTTVWKVECGFAQHCFLVRFISRSARDASANLITQHQMWPH